MVQCFSGWNFMEYNFVIFFFNSVVLWLVDSLGFFEIYSVYNVFVECVEKCGSKEFFRLYFIGVVYSY